MRHRLTLVVSLVLSTFLGTLGMTAPAVARTAAPSYRTILIGRAMDGLCNAKTGARSPAALSLVDIAQQLQARGMTATLNVVVDRMPATGPGLCLSGRLYPSLETVQALVQDYGWSVNSAGYEHTTTTGETDDQLTQDACGSQADLTADGLPAPQEYAYPSGRHTAATQADIRTCPYAFGRYYRIGSYATQVSATRSNGMVPALSLSGRGSDYQSVSLVQQALTPPAGDWAQVQVYNLLAPGAYRAAGSAGGSYDCRTGHPHTTSRTEYYCADDFFAALDASIASSPTTEDTTPDRMATLWGLS